VIVNLKCGIMGVPCNQDGRVISRIDFIQTVYSA
jgi:hypothetical protein